MQLTWKARGGGNHKAKTISEGEWTKCKFGLGRYQAKGLLSKGAMQGVVATADAK